MYSLPNLFVGNKYWWQSITKYTAEWGISHDSEVGSSSHTRTHAFVPTEQVQYTRSSAVPCKIRYNIILVAFYGQSCLLEWL
jgi:hypothetical protein